jgi:predicted nucleotidyltransferase
MVLPALHEASGVRVDLVFSFTPFEREAIARARTVELGGQQLRFASPEDVIILKIFAGRPRDLEDVAAIVRNQPELDRAYIRRWLEEFDAGSDERVFLARFQEMLGTD